MPVSARGAQQWLTPKDDQDYEFAKAFGQAWATPARVPPYRSGRPSGWLRSWRSSSNLCQPCHAAFAITITQKAALIENTPSCRHDSVVIV
jgi:hypothetical protein